MDQTLEWLVAAASSLVGGILTAVLIATGKKRGWVVFPRQDRWSKRAVVQFGGVPILVAFAFGAVLLWQERVPWALLGLTFGAGVLGFVDDITGLGPRSKIASELMLAAVAVYLGFVLPLTALAWLNVAATVIWIVGITNAFNMIDNIDGLAGGIAGIGLLTIILLPGTDVSTRALSLCMLGAVCGFLIFNLHPARVFMGDSGALAIGFFLSCVAVKAASQYRDLKSAVFVPFLALFIPIFDMLLVTVTRRARGRRVSLGARDHSSHRLVLIGMSDEKAVLVLYAVAIASSGSLLFWKSVLSRFGGVVVAIFLLGAILMAFHLTKLKLPESCLSASRVQPITIPDPIVRFLQTPILALVDTGLVAAGLYLAFLGISGDQFRPLETGFLIACGGSALASVSMLALRGCYGKRSMNIESNAEILKNGLFAAISISVLLLAVLWWKHLPMMAVLLSALVSPSLLVMRQWASAFLEQSSPIDTDQAVKDDEPMDVAVAK